MPRCPRCHKWYWTRKGWNLRRMVMVCPKCVPKIQAVEPISELKPDEVEVIPYLDTPISPSVWHPDLRSPVDEEFKSGGGEFGGAGASGGWEPTSDPPPNDSPPQDSPGDSSSDSSDSSSDSGSSDSGSSDSGGGSSD